MNGDNSVPNGPENKALSVRTASADYDFGWSLKAMTGHYLVAAAILSGTLGLQLEYPAVWPLWFILALLGLVCVLGGLMLRTSKRHDFVSLPLVDLLTSDRDLVLDAGCGSGRTTLALMKVLRTGRVVALDRFDAYYITGGGRELLERNLRIAGLSDRVQIEKGDLTAMPFADATFDSAVSAHVMDHLKDKKRAGLSEVYRVLKPGGRFLMVVWVPGLVTFSLANVFCFLLTGKSQWRKMASEVGFVLKDEGTFNGMWFAVLERPR